LAATSDGIDQFDDGYIGILLGNGDGTLLPSFSYEYVGAIPDGIALGDMNGDGKMDIAVSNQESSTISVLLGNGDGTFQSQLMYYALFSTPYTLALGDFNNDGKLDVATATYDTSNVNDAFVQLQTTVTLAPWEVSLGYQPIGQSSHPYFVTLSNQGNTAINMNSASLTGTNERDFSFINLCGKTLVAGQSCKFRIIFTPGNEGPRSAMLNINDSAVGSPQEVALSGVGKMPEAQPTPASLAFSAQLVGTPSPVQQIQLYNGGDWDLAIYSVTATGDFSAYSDCGTGLLKERTCHISVKFWPKGLGLRSGTVTITDDAVGSPQTIPLTGTGTAFMLSPTSLDFGDVTVGTTSTPHTVTLTNAGINPQTIYSIGLAGANPMQFALTNNCPSSLGVGQSCTVLVTFSPTGFGAKSATLQVGGGGGTEVVTLTGNGS